MKHLFLFFLLASTSLFAQKKILDHTVYNDWKRIGDVKLSNDGKYTAYTIKPFRGDGYLYVINNETGRKDSIFRGIGPVFSGDNSFIAFKVTPGFDTLRKNELNKVKKEKWPKDSLGIFILESQTLKKIDKVKSFYVSPESNWVVYLADGNKLPEGKKKKCWFRKKKTGKAYESEGNVMVMYVPSLDKKSRVKDVKHVFLPEKGNYYAYVLHQKEKTDSFEIHVGNQGSGQNWTIPTKFNAISDINFNHAGTQMVFTASLDTAKTKSYQLFHADMVNSKFAKLIDTVNANLPADDRVSDHFSPYFSWNGNHIFFGVAEKPEAEPKDTLLENEKARLDIWNWQDDRLQPQQLVELGDDEKKTKFSVYDLATGDFKILGSDTLEIRTLDHGNSDFAVGFSVKPYQSAYNWEYPNKRDFYRVDLKTGAVRLIKKALGYNITLSPNGRYFAYYNETDQQQYLLDLSSGTENCMTCGTKAEWLEDVNGMPQVPSPFGATGWIKGENELLISSKYDLWSYQINEQKLVPLTGGEGEKQKIRFSLNEWETDSAFIYFENTYFTGFHEKDKSMSLYKPKFENGKLSLVEQFQTAHELSGIKKAKYADQYVFQKSSVQDYPDAHLANWNVPEVSKQISFANPQQSQYNWATVELLAWTSYDGIPLEGLLYKPENYDSTKKYPLLVYFYEMYSDELHSHYAPKPTASIIFPTEYASAGYFILIPDIRYKPGYPAHSAYDCIMSGTDYVLKKYKAVDSTRMGLQGQSWGGYQTAQLITMTNRYKVAMAGAPVGNMFSAYGGIRWGSGLNRQFQYEKTQSRIGKTIWEAPELYVENSPVFHLPKVQTPLLIMHNDGDGSVPWYQGVEIFTGLKRLGKPVWLLNYNGDDHNLMKSANRIDLSIRMRQFFDYYLMDAPAPQWLKEGVPATEKGKNYGLGKGSADK